MPRPTAILTVDYEDWFHVAEPALREPHSWGDLPSSVEQDTLTILDLLDEHGAHATFFAVGWLVDRTRRTVREIAHRGHRLALHGYHHVPPNAMSISEFRQDIRRCSDSIANAAGIPAVGYRAPYFGVRDCRFPYIDVLRECGLTYDASVFPGLLPGRGMPGAPATPHVADTRSPPVWEIPVSVVRMFGLPFAFSGGGFLRLLPAWCVRSCARRVSRQGVPVVYYVHPRDLNSGGLMAPACRWNRTRYYGGRATVRGKLIRALNSSRVVSVEEFLSRPATESQREASRCARTSSGDAVAAVCRPEPF